MRAKLLRSVGIDLAYAKPVVICCMNNSDRVTTFALATNTESIMGLCNETLEKTIPMRPAVVVFEVPFYSKNVAVFRYLLMLYAMLLKGFTDAGVRVEAVHPSTWKAEMLGKIKGKEVSIARASERLAAYRKHGTIDEKRIDDYSDAIHLADYGHRKVLNGTYQV